MTNTYEDYKSAMQMIREMRHNLTTLQNSVYAAEDQLIEMEKHLTELQIGRPIISPISKIIEVM